MSQGELAFQNERQRDPPPDDGERPNSAPDRWCTGFSIAVESSSPPLRLVDVPPLMCVSGMFDDGRLKARQNGHMLSVEASF